MKATARLETYSADYSSKIEHARATDGSIWRRYQFRGAYGYAWTRWQRAYTWPERGIELDAAKVRLPNAA